MDDVGYDVADSCVATESLPAEPPARKISVPVESDFIYVYSPITTGTYVL